ncbi:MAG: hypothetical protein N3E37_02875 [Candidatus Micrarchaeota archaeon]|nr:hypothetical protein [Candidatus Micrarchaeota archaeon]
MGSNLSFFKSLIKQKAKVSYYRDLSLKKSRLEFNTFTLIFDPNIKSNEIISTINQITYNTFTFNPSHLNKLRNDLEFFLSTSAMCMDTVLKNDNHFLKLSFLSVDSNIILNIIDLSFINNFNISKIDQILNQTTSTIWVTDKFGSIKGVSEQWDITAKYYEELEKIKGSNRKAVYSKDLLGKNFSSFLVGKKSKIFYSFVKLLINLFGKLSHEYWAQSPCESECKQEELLHMLYLKQKLKIGNKIYHLHQSINFTQLTDALLLELYLNRQYHRHNQFLKFKPFSDYNLFLLLNSFQSNELFLQNLHNYLLLINRNYRISNHYLGYQISNNNNNEYKQNSSTSSNSNINIDYSLFSRLQLSSIIQRNLKLMELEYGFENQMDMHMLFSGQQEIQNSIKMNAFDHNQSTNNVLIYQKNIKNDTKQANYDRVNDSSSVIRNADNLFLINYQAVTNKTRYALLERSSKLTDSIPLEKVKNTKNNITSTISTPDFKQHLSTIAHSIIISPQIHKLILNNSSIKMLTNQHAQPLPLLPNNFESLQLNFMARAERLFEHCKCTIEANCSKTYLRFAQPTNEKHHLLLNTSLIYYNHLNISCLNYEVYDSQQMMIYVLPEFMDLILYNNHLQKVELVMGIRTIYDNMSYRIMHNPKVIDINRFIQHTTNKKIFIFNTRDSNTKLTPIESGAMKLNTVITDKDDKFVVSLIHNKSAANLHYIKRLQNIQYLYLHIIKLISNKLKKGYEKRKKLTLWISNFFSRLFEAFRLF